MGRRSRRARKTRQGSEFDLAQLIGRLEPPKQPQTAYGWSLDAIRAARDLQLAGKFSEPVKLAKAMRTDYALFTAYQNRLAPQRCIGVELVPPSESEQAKRVAGEAEALFGERGVAITTEGISSINGTLANHCIAVGAVAHTPRADGSRVDLEMRSWPLEFCEWSPNDRCLVTRVHGSNVRVPIIHGDGRWVVFQKHEEEPWTQEPCVLPGGLLWASHAFGLRDWSQGSKSHGLSRVIGEMPAGVPLQNADGQLSAEAAAFVQLLLSLYQGDLPVGVQPSGAKTQFVTNNSTAWQVWEQLILMGDKAAARIYLGTDGMLGSQGGAPGVDIATLFGVATTIVQGDLSAIERAILTGVIEPWAAINFGDSTLAPYRRYLMPDADADAERESFAKRLNAFHAAVEQLRKNGFEVAQESVNALAQKFAVPAPTLPDESKRAPSITLAPTDIARVVKVNEARASAGLPALTLASGQDDPDGQLTVEEFAAKKAAAVKTAEQQHASPPSTPPTPPPNGAPKPAPALPS
jgi:hypothetical protein